MRRRPSRWPSRPPRAARCSRRFPSWACRPTPATISFTRRPCWTPAKRRWPRWSKPRPIWISPSSWARRCAWTTSYSIAPWWRPAAACWAWCPRATCPTTANSTKPASSAPPIARPRPTSACWARPCRSGPSCCSGWKSCRCSSSTSKSAKTSGCLSRRRPTPRWPAPRCWSTCPPPISSSARPNTATSLFRSSRRAACRPICTPRPAGASPRRTWPGTARRSSTKTANCWPSPSAS
ncbi:hypothetical protein D3C85_773410 [compost metagenome]